MRIFPLIKRGRDPLFPDFALEGWFDDFFRWPFRRTLGIFETLPAVDIYEKNNTIVAKVEIPGVKPEDIKLSVDGNLLTISGEKKEEHEVKKENYHRIESCRGKFQRTVELPVEVNAEAAKATYKNGILKVELPKTESRRGKEIKIVDIK